MINRLHEWFAEHVPWVQYPGVTAVGNKRRIFRWKHQMAWHERLFLCMFSLFWVIVLGAILIALLVAIWAFFGAALGFH